MENPIQKHEKTYTLESCLPAIIVFPPYSVNSKSNQKDINNHHCPNTYVQGLDLTITEFWTGL